MAPADPTLFSDIPCAFCGYDLRGLPPAGQCPECGGSIADSLAQVVVERARIGDGLQPSIDPRWRQTLLYAVGAALLAALIPISCITIALLVRPREAGGRVWVIVCMAVGWVLQWYAAFKLSEPEPDPGPSRWRVLNRRVLRISATVYAVVPVAWIGLERWQGDPPAGAVVKAAYWCVIPACVSFFFQVGLVFRHLALRPAAGCAASLAFLLPVSIFSYAGFPNWDPSRPPAEMLILLPNLGAGPLLYLPRVALGLWRSNDMTQMLALHAAVSLLGICLQVRLLVALVRARVAGRSPSPRPTP